METNGNKNRLEKAKEDKTFLKLIFIYPASPRAMIKNGYVKETYDNSFDFEDKFDGLVTYSYNYIVEIKAGEHYEKSH